VKVRLGILGYGRIGRRMRQLADDHASEIDTVAVLPRRGDADGLAVSDLAGLIARRPDVVVECASPEALAELAPPLLAAGIDVIPLSLTALADRTVELRIREAAREGPGRLEIPPGAMGALDLLAAAREAGLSRVVYRQCKSPEMWKRTPAAALADLDTITIRSVFLAGSVREIAGRFPNNLNVSVGVALAGLGLDATRCELVADPAAQETSHELDIAAPPGDVTLRIGGRRVGPDGDPVDYSTFSLIRLLRRRAAPLAV
jgi:aspartate dehydrogenase